MSARHFARYLFSVLLYYSGMLFALRCVRRARRRRRVVVLAYHSFSDTVRYLEMAIPPSLFVRQLRYVCDHFDVRTVSQLVAGRHTPQAPDTDIAVVTVDDGYADNFEVLLDATRKFGVPATVYLTTDCLDRQEPTSVMWIMLAIHHASVTSIDLPELGSGPIFIRTHDEKEVFIRRVDAALKPLPEAERRVAIDSLLERSGAAAKVRLLASSTMLSWEQVRQMHAAGVEFGGHTLTHPVLSRLPRASVCDEIEKSLQRIREVLGVETVTFAYPYGGAVEVNDAIVDTCRAGSASAAVVLTRSPAFGVDMFRTPRVMVTSDQCTGPWGRFSTALWACELEGVIDTLRNFARRFVKRSSQEANA